MGLAIFTATALTSVGSVAGLIALLGSLVLGGLYLRRRREVNWLRRWAAGQPQQPAPDAGRRPLRRRPR